MPAPGFPVHPEQSPRQTSFEGVRVREDTLYSNSQGKERGGVRKRAQKAIAQLKDALLRVLAQDETVLYVTSAQALPSKLEELFLGWIAYSTHRGVLVFSNTRLLYLITGRGGKWQRSIRTAQWGDIEEAHVKGWLSPTLQIKYRDGARETYWRLRRGDARKIKALLAAVLPVSLSETSPARGMAHLCPDCLTGLTGGVYKCPRCGLGFKDESTMVRRSLMFPGLGYFYAGHAGLGILDIVFEAFLLFEIVIWVLIATGIIQPPPRQRAGEAAVTAQSAWFTVAILAAILGFKKWLTTRHCRRFIKEFIPVK
jgi:hypothetical protein